LCPEATPKLSQMGQQASDRPVFRRIAITALEILAWVLLATGIVAGLDRWASVTALGSVYLIAVLAVAVRRGQIAAIITAVVGVETLNFFFVEPLHRFEVSESEDLVALAVLLVAAFVVGRLAGTARERAAEAEERADLAAAREREAAIVADAASSLLGGLDLDRLIEGMSGELATTTDGVLALEVSSAPERSRGETSIRLPTEARSVWLYSSDEAHWSRDDLERLSEPLSRLLDVAAERERAAERASEVEAARRAEVAKTAVLHAISHDLRSPLTAIQTAAAGLDGSEIDPGDREALVSVIEDESDRLARLVDNLLDLSRIEAGAAEPRLDWCDLSDVVASAVAQVQGAHPDAPIQLSIPAELPLVKADASQLERVFTNLVENAIKFSPPGTPVRISGGVGAGKVTMRVTDQGPGVPPTQRSQIFEPFFQGARSEGGTGLGLAISRGFVEANGGEIRLQADAADGTSFAVSFPLVRQPAAAR
jgi:two-component system, OmpR family, sensor histidine kinase KdpD